MKGAAIVCVAACLVGGCQRPPEEPVIEPLEDAAVEPPVDATVTLDYDLAARPSREGFANQLPSEFPRDLPLYASSSLINQGPASGERLFVELSVPAQLRVVRRNYDSQLESAGWRPTDGDEGVFERSGRSVRVTYRQGTPGTWIRIEYPT